MNESLTYLRTLEEAGFTRQQAEAQMAVFSDTIRTTTATRNDLTELKSEMRLEFADVRSEMALTRTDLKSDIAQIRTDMRSLEDRITIRLGGLMIVGIGALAALIKLT